MKLNLRKTKKNEGFTLIELMIVVAIIGILAAIAIPNFRNYQLKSKRGELPINLKAIKVAELAYQAEHDTFLALNDLPSGTMGTTKRNWPSSGTGNFANIGWAPTGPVYGNYNGAANSNIETDIILLAKSDLDKDGNTANYEAVADVITPSRETEPTLTTSGNVF